LGVMDTSCKGLSPKQAAQKELTERGRALPGVAALIDVFDKLVELVAKMSAVNVQPYQILNATGGNVTEGNFRKPETKEEGVPNQAQWKDAPDELGWWVWCDPEDCDVDNRLSQPAGLVLVTALFLKLDYKPGIRWLRIPDPPIPR